MASYRHLARIVVMQAVFVNEFRGLEAQQALKYAANEFDDKLKDLSFAETLLDGIVRKKADIHKILIEEAPEWPIDKIAPVDRAILEMGIYEIMFSGDVPPIVAINEAVEIAKSYGDLNAPKFVNGVLSTVMHKYCKGVDKKAAREENENTANEKTISPSPKK